MKAQRYGDDGKWEVFFYYKDYTGKRIQKHKRGFKTKKEAVEWAEEFKSQKAKRLDMTFESFVSLYMKDMGGRLRENTLRSKRYLIDLKILPYFGKRKIAEITAADIRLWQTDMMGNDFAQTYLKSINNQLAAIFNYAERYYDLSNNPCRKAGTMGESNADEMEVWSVDEFNCFLECVENKPLSYYAFLTMFWTGVRVGELLALTVEDFDSENRTLRINKSLQRIDGKDIITDPKTKKSKRVITLPENLVLHLQEYIEKMYAVKETDRLFPITKSYLEHEIERGIKESGVKKIRLHDLRHSHASVLISQLGAQPKLVAERLGHEKVRTTLEIYSHLFPNQNMELADMLDNLNTKNDKEDGEEDK